MALEHEGLRWDVDGFTGSHNLEFLKKLQCHNTDHPKDTYFLNLKTFFSKYQQDHDGRRLKGMDKNQLETLLACEAKALKALGGDNGLLRLVEEFTFHWQLRDACDNGLQMDWENPQPNTVYLEEDYLETNSKSTEKININKFGSLGSVGQNNNQQEMDSLPIGPVQCGPSHFANTRLAYTTYICRVWGKGMQETFFRDKKYVTDHGDLACPTILALNGLSVVLVSC